MTTQQCICLGWLLMAIVLMGGGGLFQQGSGDLHVPVVSGGVLILVVLLLWVVRIIRLHERVGGFRRKHGYSSARRSERKAFAHLQSRLRLAHDPQEWWQVVCQTGACMHFAWILFQTTGADGRVEQRIWRASRIPPEFSRIVTMTMPMKDDDSSVTRQFEIGICANGSLEAATRKATLFGRLLDESEPHLTYGVLQAPKDPLRTQPVPFRCHDASPNYTAPNRRGTV